MKDAKESALEGLFFPGVSSINFSSLSQTSRILLLGTFYPRLKMAPARLGMLQGVGTYNIGWMAHIGAL